MILKCEVCDKEFITLMEVPGVIKLYCKDCQVPDQEEEFMNHIKKMTDEELNDALCVGPMGFTPHTIRNHAIIPDFSNGYRAISDSGKEIFFYKNQFKFTECHNDVQRLIKKVDVKRYVYNLHKSITAIFNTNEFVIAEEIVLATSRQKSEACLLAWMND